MDIEEYLMLCMHEQLNLNLTKYPGLGEQIRQYCDRHRIRISDFAAQSFQKSLSENYPSEKPATVNSQEFVKIITEQFREEFEGLRQRIEALENESSGNAEPSDDLARRVKILEVLVNGRN